MSATSTDDHDDMPSELWFQLGAVELPIVYEGDPYVGQVVQKWLQDNKDDFVCKMSDVTSLSQGAAQVVAPLFSPVSFSLWFVEVLCVGP